MKKREATYKRTESYKPANEKEARLLAVLASLKTKEEAMALVRDLMTVAEIEEFANRLEIVRLLSKGMPYLAVAAKLGVSTTTVTRVAHWLNHGMGGYRKALKTLLR